MRHLKYAGAFFCGAVIFALLAIAAAIVITILADAGAMESFAIGVEPFVLYSFERTSDSFAFSMGPGVIIVGVAGGLLNCALLALLERLTGPAKHAKERVA